MYYVTDNLRTSMKSERDQKLRMRDTAEKQGAGKPRSGIRSDAVKTARLAETGNALAPDHSSLKEM